MLRAWRDPRGLILDKTASVREPLALATLMGACALMFVAEWPGLARQAQLDPAVPLDARIGGALLSVVFALPLALYVLAMLSHLVARAMGGQGSGFAARMALFQALLAAAPVALLYGLIDGLAGPGPAATLAGLLWGLGFLWLWLVMLWTVQKGPTHV